MRPPPSVDFCKSAMARSLAIQAGTVHVWSAEDSVLPCASHQVVCSIVPPLSLGPATDSGATTCWQSPEPRHPGEFPRSHCRAGRLWDSPPGPIEPPTRESWRARERERERASMEQTGVTGAPDSWSRCITPATREVEIDNGNSEHSGAPSEQNKTERRARGSQLREPSSVGMSKDCSLTAGAWHPRGLKIILESFG